MINTDLETYINDNLLAGEYTCANCELCFPKKNNLTYHTNMCNKLIAQIEDGNIEQSFVEWTGGDSVSVNGRDAKVKAIKVLDTYRQHLHIAWEDEPEVIRKFCKKCTVWTPIDEFEEEKNDDDGLASECIIHRAVPQEKKKRLRNIMLEAMKAKETERVLVKEGKPLPVEEKKDTQTNLWECPKKVLDIIVANFLKEDYPKSCKHCSRRFCDLSAKTKHEKVCEGTYSQSGIVWNKNGKFSKGGETYIIVDISKQAPSRFTSPHIRKDGNSDIHKCCTSCYAWFTLDKFGKGGARTWDGYKAKCKECEDLDNDV
nr:hypothetical protein K-LCC10_0235 [Kaumoebavirus]